MDSNLV